MNDKAGSRTTQLQLAKQGLAAGLIADVAAFKKLY